MLEAIKAAYEGYKARAFARTTLARLETRRAELALRIADYKMSQESWGREGPEYDAAWKASINTQLRGSGDEKTARSLSTIVSTMIPESRRLFLHNPFAKSAVINLQNFCIGGQGYQYRKTGANQEKVTDYWNEWMKRTSWRDTEHEALKRLLRDGMVIVRWFNDTPRFVEPNQLVSDSTAPWGVITDPRDNVVIKKWQIAYSDPGSGLIDTTKVESVPAEQIQFLKWPGTSDQNTLIPMPPLYFVAANLEGAARCLKNMRELVAVQTAIAIVREHIDGVTGTQIDSWNTANADASVTDGDTTNTVYQRKWQSGLVVEVPHGEKLHFPAAAMRADSYIEVVQADLRAVAASLGLPEFIFTANASSSNYASLMAAEGPAAKAFETIQGMLGRFFEGAFDRVIAVGVKGGTRVMGPNPLDGTPAWPRIPVRVLKLPNSIIAPAVRTRDAFAEARTRHIEATDGVLSPQDWCGERGRDYDETMAEIEAHKTAHPLIPWPPTTSAQGLQAQDEFGTLVTAADQKAQADAALAAKATNTTTGSQKKPTGGAGGPK